MLEEDKVKDLESCKKTRGATMVEYAVMVIIIFVVVFAGVKFFGQNLSGLFSAYGQKLGEAKDAVSKT
ncbi:MAG: Flp family type IVb pilin [Bdellovibrionota bacterium]|jgi:Flp pilus assembly pilin Flp